MIRSTLPEHTVLKPLPATPQDENLWPIFQLDDVQVYTTDHRGRSFPTELWRGTVSQPVSVEGTLRRLPRDQHKSYVNPASRLSTSGTGPRIRIEQCTYWSYGQYEDGIVAWWAAGEAGWFALKPAQSYKAIYKSMKQAIELLYFVADLHRESLKRAGSGVAKRRASLALLTAERLFAEYEKEPKHKCTGQKAVTERFLEHGEVLITLMKEGREAAGWKWEDTKVFDWLTERVPDFQSPDSPGSAISMVDSVDEDAMSTSTSSTTHPRVSGKGRSSLRPKFTPGAGSYRVRTRSSTAASNEDTDMAEAEDADEVSLNNHKRKSSRSAANRRVGRPPKRVSTTGLSSSQIPSPPSDSTSSEDPSKTIPLPISDQPLSERQAQRKAQPNSAPSLTLTTSTLPTYDPTPGTDTWHCPLDGCATTYYGVTTQPGVKDMIREHYADHAVESQRQIDLVFAEERPYLPVGNLLRRIKGLVAAEQMKAGHARPGEPSAPAAAEVKPIVRRY